MKIGIDVGGTKTEGILLDPNGTEIDRKRINTEKSYDGTIKGILSIINHFEDKHGKAESVGMGMPGAISNDTALIKNANSIWLNGKPFKQDLDKILNRNINIENDANCFTLSEAVDGAGKGYQVVFGVIIGTGVGGGISINQKVIRGRNSISGEWGHIVLPSRTEDEKKYVKKCYCGKDGCLETYISGPGFSSVYNLRCNKNYNSHQILDGFNNKEKDLMVQDAMHNFRVSQIENEGNDPSESGESYGTPHDLASIYGRRQDSKERGAAMGEVPTGYEEEPLTGPEGGRPREKMTIYGTNKDPLGGRDRLGQQKMKGGFPSDNDNVNEVEVNDSLAKSTYFKNKDIFEDKKQLIFESKPKFKSKMLDEDQLKDLEK